MTVEFTHSSKGLLVRFSNLTQNPETATPLWDFGDGETSNEVNPTHLYDGLGRYTVTLKYLSGEQTVGEFSKTLMVSDKARTTLADTIYLLINTYLPEDIFGEINPSLKQQYIQKWQLYIGPLVNHCIPIDEIYNELFYEALENQLIMELAAYDYMILKVNQMVQGLSTHISNTTASKESGEGGNTGEVKHITTGPTEVEYFNGDDFDSDALSAIIKAMNPEGIIALMKQQVCMLSARLDIYLPICNRLPDKKVVPRVVDRRKPQFLGGPDPMEVIKR